jgi:hypothetical protein
MPTEAIPELDPRAEWAVHQRPFRHLRAERVFRPDVYDRLRAEFAALQPQFKTSQPRYDALMVAMGPRLAPRFAPLFDRPWLTLLASLVDVPFIPQVDGGLHHIPAGSRSGWVHNDFCSAWFDDGLTGDVVFPDRKKCDYFTGAPASPGARPKEYVRAATMIFYLENDSWSEGAGGETGLYQASHAELGTMSAVPPVSNSLLLFECSPHSYHRLIGNPGCPRNSIILWLHEPVERAESTWGTAVHRRNHA